MATVQARLGDWEASLRAVKPWLAEALRTSGQLEVGSGNGPVNHFHHLPSASLTSAGLTPAATRGPLRRDGDFAEMLRAETAADLEAIFGLDFIKGLADGTLPEKEFAYYLAQDAIYLNGYSRVLARASALAPTESEQLFWARSAQQCLEVESELHRNWLSTRTVQTGTGPRHEGLRGPSAGCFGVRQLRRAGGRGPAMLLALRRRRGVPARANTSRPARLPGTRTPNGCGPTPTRTSPPPRGRPSASPTRPGWPGRRPSGRRW